MIRVSPRYLWLLTAASILAILAGACQANPTPPPLGSPGPTRQVAPQVGALAPDFTVKTLAGDTLKLSDLRGKPVMLNFWATWCPPCKQEMPLIQAAFKDPRYSKLSIVAMDQNEDAATISDFMKQFGYTFPITLDPGLAVSNTYGVYAIPTTFLIGTDGVIRVKKIGAFLSKADLESSLSMIM